MKKYRNYTLAEYLDVLAKKEPVPGGGSAAALTASLGVGLIVMAANYSKGKSGNKAIEQKIVKTIKDGNQLKKRLLELVDLDAQAYLRVVKARKKSTIEKNKAKRAAKSVPMETCRLCYKAIQLTPFLVKRGNKHLMSDVEAAAELLLAAFNAAMINVEINS